MKKYLYSFIAAFFLIIGIAVATPCHTNVAYFLNAGHDEVKIELFSSNFNKESHLKQIVLKPYTQIRQVSFILDAEASLCLQVEGQTSQDSCYGYMVPFYELGNHYFIINRKNVISVSSTKDENLWEGLTFIWAYVHRFMSCSI